MAESIKKKKELVKDKMQGKKSQHLFLSQILIEFVYSKTVLFPHKC